jgi:hypothetical protein
MKWNPGHPAPRRDDCRVTATMRRSPLHPGYLLVYGKSVRENIPAHVLRQIKEEIENA